MKYLSTLVLGILLIVPSVSFAQTITPEQESTIMSLIQALTVQVQALEARLVVLENQPTFGSTMAQNQTTYQNALNDEAIIEASVADACTVPIASNITLAEAGPNCTSVSGQLQQHKSDVLQTESSLHNQVLKPEVLANTTRHIYHVGDKLINPITGKWKANVTSVDDYGSISCWNDGSGPGLGACGG